MQSDQQPVQIPQSPPITPQSPKKGLFDNEASGYFYYIAGISLINSLLFIFGFGFYGSLGITTVITGIAKYIAETVAGGTGVAFIINLIGFFINAVIAGIVALFGYLSSRGHGWVYVVGMIAYTVDALIMLWLGDWIEVLIHLYFLYLLWKGWSLLRKARKDMESLNPPVIS